MRRVNTLQELKAEQQRLRIHQAFLESEMRKDYANFKTTLAPLAMIGKSAKTLLSSKDNSLVGTSIGSITNFITKSVILRNSGLITKLVVPYLVKNVTSNLAENNKSKIVDWVGSLISRFAGKKSEPEPQLKQS